MSFGLAVLDMNPWLLFAEARALFYTSFFMIVVLL